MQNDIPPLLQGLQVNPEFMRSPPTQQRWIDGYMIPFRNLTIFQTGSGAGKSTSVRNAALSYAATGDFHLFGKMRHEKPGKVVILAGEETADNIRTSLQHIPGALENYNIGVESGRLIIVSMLDIRNKVDGPTSLLGNDGLPTKLGEDIFDSIREFKPDLFVLDTLTSVSDTEYLDGVSAKNAVLYLSALCDSIGCAGISLGHVGKGTNDKITEDIDHESLIAVGRGSGLLVASARHAIVLARAPRGMFATLHTEERDEVWIGTLKSNLEHPAARTIFPVVRSAAKRTLIATDGQRSLASIVENTETHIKEALEDVIYAVVKAAAQSKQPLASTGGMSPASLAETVLRPILPEGGSKKMVSAATDDLIRRELIVICRPSKTGTPVLDLPDGMYATDLDTATGSPPDFRKGAPNIEALRDAINEDVKLMRELRGAGDKNPRLTSA